MDSVHRFSYQSERSAYGHGSFRLQSKIGLFLNRTENRIFDRRIWVQIG